jgi:hypothetical protein
MEIKFGFKNPDKVGIEINRTFERRTVKRGFGTQVKGR